MSLNVSRRNFVQHAAPGAAILLGAGGSWAFSADDASDWCFPLLGDLHIDRPEHHDQDWLAKEHPGDVSQVTNYCRITREVTPKLLEVVRRRSKSPKRPSHLSCSSVILSRGSVDRKHWHTSKPPMRSS